MNREIMYYYQGEVDAGARNKGSSKGNNQEQLKNEVLVCNCNRSPETILCKVCGRSFVGRRRMQCQKHRNTIHLMDCAYCVFCKRQL